MWNNGGQIYHTAPSKYLYICQFRTFYYCFKDCCNLIVSAYTTILAPVLWAWIFLSCTKCSSYIFRVVSLTFSECKNDVRAQPKSHSVHCLCAEWNLHSFYSIYYYEWSRITLVCLRFLFSSLFILSPVPNTYEWRTETWQRQLWYASKVPNKMLYLRGTP